jgi:ATP-binding cassette subfamily B protein
MRALHHLWPYLRRYRSRYVIGLVMIVFAAGAGAAAPLFVKEAIDTLKNPASVTSGHILRIAGALIALAALRSLLVFRGRFKIISLSRDLEFEMRGDLYRHLLSLPAKWFDSHPTGDITSRFINDLEGVRMMVGFAVVALAGTGLLFVCCIAGMVWVDWKLALICLIPLSLISLVTFFTSGRVHDRSLKVQDELGIVSTRAQENFTGARVIKAFAQEDAEDRRFSAVCSNYLDANVSLARLRGVMFAAMTLFIELAIAVTLYFGGRGIIGGAFTEGEFVAFTAWQFMLVWPMVAIGWVVAVVQRGIACMGRLNEILDAKPAERGAETVELVGAIDVRNLTFRYVDDRRPALEDVSFSVKPGQKVGIVGRTGSGKSALAALLMKLYQAPRGAVFLDGRDVNDIETGSLRRASGVVSSEPFIFSDSLRANIAFGAEKATDDDIARAAQLARIAGDAERFPEKMNQLIGERGVTLSGGQKQRTAIARALIRRPRLLILDDALSSVDAHTEREILDELREYMKGRTSIVISHRMSAVRDCDRILVLDEGRLIESGTHDELVAKRGLYALMCERQQLLEELDADDSQPAPAVPVPPSPPPPDPEPA